MLAVEKHYRSLNFGVALMMHTTRFYYLDICIPGKGVEVDAANKSCGEKFHFGFRGFSGWKSIFYLF